MIAGILGYNRDEYYEVFSSKNCKIGLQVMKPVRHLLQVVNYLMTDEEAISSFKREFKWWSEPAQVRLELITTDEQKLSEVYYRIFFHHEDALLMNHLEDSLRSRKFYYPPSLGTANNLATLKYVDSVNAEIFKPSGYVPISTVIPLPIEMEPEKGLRIRIEELVPVDFSKDRYLEKKKNYIYEETGKPIKVKVDGDVFKCKVNGEEIIGTFM
jgi:CRISPR-associated protein Cas5h